jgi:hypothetical protein
MLMKRFKPFAVPFLLTVAGLFIRVYRLGVSSLQIDNFLFWDLFHRDISTGQIFSQWMELTGLTGQLPLAAASAKLFLDALHLPLTFGTLILPFALCGALAVPVAYMAGREFGGRRMAVLLAAMIAFSPLCIQMSREAYFYAPTLLGAFLALWAAGLSGRLLAGRAVPRWFHVVNAAAFFLMTWSSPSSWPYAFFFALFNVALFGWRVIRHRRGIADLLILLATYCVIGLPLLLAPWGLKQITEFTSAGATRDYWTKVFAAGRGESQWAKVWPVLCAYAWGATPLRQIFSALVLLSGTLFFITGFRKNRAFTCMGLIFAVVLILNIMAVQKSVWIFGITRIVPLVPFYLLFLSAGLLWPFEMLRGKRVAAFALLLPAAAFALWVEPLVLIPAVIGKTRPYMEIAAWADAALPPGTPILTDRYFTAYNEFRVHAPANVQFVSTAPNQIPEQYNGLQFRERARRFFDANPGAAFFEEKHLWSSPETGPWPEIRERFARFHTVTDRAGLRLAQLGLCYRADTVRPVSEDPFSGTIWYNLPEDIIKRARAEGREAVAIFGAGWQTVSTRDYRVWRLLQNEASMEVWNLTDAPQQVSLVIHGVAAGGAKQIVLSAGEKKLFQNGQMTDWTAGPVLLAPGKNTLTLRDPLKNEKIPLLVSSVEVQP